ncbi:MAG: HEAT repeat domain-containing protein [Pirellulales bacterium]
MTRLGSTLRYDQHHPPASARRGGSSPKRRKRRRGVPSVGLIFMLMASILVGGSIGLILRRDSPDVLANRLLQQFEAMPEAEVPAAMERAAASETIGLPLLAAALSSNRDVVVHEAQRLLDERMKQIKAQPPQQAAGALDQLASALSANVEKFSPSARATARSIAEQLLQWPIESSEQGRIDLVAHCERILRGDDAARPPSHDAFSIGGGTLAGGPAGGSSGYEQGRMFYTPSMERSVAQYAVAPGGHVPYQTLPMPSMPRTHLPTHGDGGPRPLEAPNNAEPLQPQNHPQLLPPQPPTSPVAESRPAAERSAYVVQPLPQPQLADDAPSSARPSLEVQSATTLQLVMTLPQVSTAELPALEQELLRRGFTSADFQLVARFNSPNLTDRRSMVPLVANAPTPWALQWLIWLSYDNSPAVRYEAISMLSTARDPAIVQRMEEATRTEPNPEILRLAESYLQRLRQR